jgi:hypothetical protein
LEFGLAGAVVAAGASVVAVNDQSEEALDAWPCLLEVSELRGIGELA